MSELVGGHCLELLPRKSVQNQDPIDLAADDLAVNGEEFAEAQWHLTRAIARAGPEGVAKLGEIMKGDSNAQRKYAVLEVLSRFHRNEAVGVLREALALETDQKIREKIAHVIAETESR